MKLFLFLSAALLVLTSCSSRPEPAPLAEIATTMQLESGETNIAHLDVETARALYEHRGDLVVLDLRTPLEYNEGHIPGALNFSFDDPDFAKQVDQLRKDRPYLVHDNTDSRSTNALDTFNQEQFQRIYYLVGGWEAWRSEPNPVAPGPYPLSQMLSNAPPLPH